MKKIRCFLATIALIVTPGGLSLSGMGVVPLANATASWHVRSISASSVAGQGTKSFAFKPYGACPYGSSDDC